jgi:DNA-binding transcriptional ArsR family regulator
MAFYPNRGSGTLFDSHRHTLEVGSAISHEVYEESGVCTVTHGDQLPRGFSKRQRGRRGGILFMGHRPNGETFYIFRPDDPDPDNPGLRYEAPCKKLGGPGNVLYVHPGQRELIDDTSVPVIFVEGIKKALSIITAARAAGEEVLVVAISGVWNWLSDGKPISDMFDIPVEGRMVYICFDSDVFRNPDVSDAARRFASHLIGRGALVYLSYLPCQADGSKTGADDFLAGGHSYRELMALMRLYNPRDLQAERLNRGEQIRFMLEDLRRAFWAAEFKGMGGHSARDLYKVLIDAALDRGKLHADGLRVKISRSELARMSKVSTRTLQKAIERLEEMGLIYRDNENRKQRERGAFVLRAKVNRYREGLANSPKTADGKTEVTLSSLQLRAPRLMWSSPKVKARRGLVKGTRMVRQGVRSEPRPAIKRLGKTRGAILDALDAGGGILTLQEIADALHRKRARDLRRRSLPMLEAAGIITVEGDVVTLAEDWLDRLEDTRELGGEIEAEEHARRRYRDKSRAYHNRQQVEPTRHYVNILGADGHIEDLEHIAEALSEADSRTLEAIEAFERKYGRGSFRWDRVSCKELFYSSRGGIWPEPEELRRIRDYVTATRGEAA